MSGEASLVRAPVPSLRARAAALAALGDPARLAIADALAVGDRSPGELATELDLPGNLLAHHLNTLERADVVERVRSESDRRRTYVRLRPDGLADLLPRSPELAASRVVFVCSHNSARSPLAAALWDTRSHVPSASAGTEPAARVNPRAEAVAARHGLQLQECQPRHVDQVVADRDLVVAVCDAAYEALAHGQAPDLHWSIPDPARIDTDEAFEAAFAQVAERVSRLADHVRPTSTTRSAHPPSRTGETP